MRRFFVQFGQFSGAFLALLFLLEIPIQWNYKTQNADMADWQKLEGINADIVFIGNSRTWHSLDADTASQKTGHNIYALAQDGWHGASTASSTTYTRVIGSDPHSDHLYRIAAAVLWADAPSAAPLERRSFWPQTL